MKRIENKQEYYITMAQIETYLQKGFSNLSGKEEKHLGELSRSAEAWELKEFPLPLNPAFKDILIFIMKQKGINQTDLSKNLEVSKSLISEILSGKKQPNIEILRNLHEHYHIDGNLLLESLTGS